MANVNKLQIVSISGQICVKNELHDIFLQMKSKQWHQKYVWKIILLPLIEFVEETYLQKIINEKSLKMFYNMDTLHTLLLDGTTDLSGGPEKIHLFMKTTKF